MYNYMVAKIQNIKLQMQPQVVTISDLSLSNVTYQNIFVSYDQATDLDPFQGINQAFSKMLHERNRIMYNYMVAKLQNFKLQMQYIVNKLHKRNHFHLIKLHDRNQIMYNYMVAPLQKSQASNATSVSACL